MFGIGTSELVVILIVALVVLGPEKLPGIMRTVGRAVGEFRRMSSDVKSTLDNEMRRLDEEERLKEMEAARRKAARRAAAEAAEPDSATEPRAEKDA